YRTRPSLRCSKRRYRLGRTRPECFAARVCLSRRRNPTGRFQLAYPADRAGWRSGQTSAAKRAIDELDVCAGQKFGTGARHSLGGGERLDRPVVGVLAVSQDVRHVKDRVRARLLYRFIFEEFADGGRAVRVFAGRLADLTVSPPIVA